jgi:uridine kinase
VNPAGVVIVDGILVLEDERVRALMDMKVYVDTDPDVRFIRRLVRDTRDRGRTTESVIRQYLDTVRPMHIQFVEPTKKYADIIVPEGGYNNVAIDMLIASIRTRIGR